MAARTLPAFVSRRTFPQPHPWPDSIQQDQRAIEQARQELGPDAAPKQILAGAQRIRLQGMSRER